ncbi:unnamed protein product [Prorocentrum cordatum]|uniref:Uncharacterized protein n=1 Tax=Prorocentrum cordatum TaxID=2364126 RepID=A0ABN9WFW2_9DINO|nr:unnamed protein product [Polarella glacialis]
MPSELDARADSASQSDLHGDGCSRPLERGAQQCLYAALRVPGGSGASDGPSSAYTRAGGCGTHGANLLARRAPAPPAEESSRGFCLCLPPLWCPHGSSSSPPRPPRGPDPRASPFLTRPPPRRVPPGASHRRRGNTLAAAALTRASSRAAVLP